MKGFLIFAVLLFPAAASAQVAAPRAVTDVELTFKSTMTCSGISVSSAVAAGSQATQVVTSTQTLWGSIAIQNRDTAANVYCGDTVAVTSGTANGTNNPQTGWELGFGSPGAAASFYLAPGQLWYCVNDSGSRTSSITVCRGR